jgi:hypothetical protein
VAGALPEAELLDLTAACGFPDGRIVERFDCFQNTSAETKVSRDLRVQGMNFFASRLSKSRDLDLAGDADGILQQA